MAAWKLDVENRKRLRALAAEASEEDQTVLDKILAKNTVYLEDIQTIKKSLPPKVALFPILSKLIIYTDTPEKEYKASAEFRAKTEKLRQKQENMAYKRMVESVDPGQKYGQVNLMENFGAEMKTVNRQLISIINVIITVVGSFFFGFTGITYAYPHLNLDLATRFLIGLILATIVFFADLYFVIKSMDAEIPDSEKSPYANSHNLNFREMTRSGDESSKTKKATKKSATEKKND